MAEQKSICVYCGSQPGKNPTFLAAARTLGKSMADRQVRLVYGGGTNGIMGEVAQSVSSNGGKVLGIIPRFLLKWEATPDSVHQYGEVIFTEDMHERKHTMFENADAFVALPGGVGTLEEIVEIMTWAQLGRHSKPMVFANINGFWDPLLSLLRHMDGEEFLHNQELMIPDVVSEADKIVPAILNRLASQSTDQAMVNDTIEKM